MSKANEISELKDLTKYRLDEINNIKEYFNAEIKERKDIVKKISKYIVAFDYADKLFITLSASFGTLSMASYATVVGIPAGIAGASLTLIFTVTTGVVKVLKKKMFGSGTTTLIISNDEMDDILKIVKSLEDSNVLLKGVSETIQHEAKEQRGGFLSILLGTLGASLLGDILSKGLYGKDVIRAGEGTIRAGFSSKKSSLKKF